MIANSWINEEMNIQREVKKLDQIYKRIQQNGLILLL
jgi:hypothetical protein